MNILYVSDDKGVLFLGVSLTSLLINNGSVEMLNIYILDDGIAQSNKKKLNKAADTYGRKITYIPKPDIQSFLGTDPKARKWPDNIFCRLFTPTLFAEFKEVKKILYIDTDTIINKDLTNLWDSDLEGHCCGGVLECMGDLHKKAIAVGKDISYLNSGMLLIDIEKWREVGLEAKCRNFAKEHLYDIEYPDEGIINAVLKGDFKVLPPKYNLTSLKAVFNYYELKTYRKSSVMYKEEEYAEALRKPSLIHYTNSFMVDRPWIKNSKYPHPYSDLWMTYKMKSLWADETLIERKKGIRQFAENIVHLFPRKLIIYIMGLVYCYLKPIKYLIRGKMI